MLGAMHGQGISEQVFPHPAGSIPTRDRRATLGLSLLMNDAARGCITREANANIVGQSQRSIVGAVVFLTAQLGFAAACST